MNDWGVYQAVVEQIVGKCKFRSLTKLKDLSGRSGAHTFLVQPRWDAGRLDPAILKVGLDAVIEKDIEGVSQARFLFPGADYLQEQARQDGVRAILLRFAGGANCETFEEFYLRATTTPEDVAKRIETLFGTTMRVESRTVFADSNPLALYNFHNPQVQSRALREIGDGLPSMVRWWERARQHCQNEPTQQSVCHGDLHRRNILVGRTDVYVVDFGLLSAGHAMRDFAKLERDILLFLYPAESNRGDTLLPLPFDEAFSEASLVNPGSAFDKALAAVTAIRTSSRKLVLESNWLFQYRVALLAQMVFAATDEQGLRQQPEARSRALRYAKRLREALEKTNAQLAIPAVERGNAHRSDLLWRYAYVFLRLDQLKSGGWGKSLPSWFEALVEGDDATIRRTPEMRSEGGTDLTVYGYIEYLDFHQRLGCSPTDDDSAVGDAARRPPSFTKVGAPVYRNLCARIGWDGGVGTGHDGRATGAAVKVRHTVIGLIGFIYYARWTGTIPASEILKTTDYLMRHLRDWEKDKSHPFGSYCSLAKLKQLLATYAPPVQGWDVAALIAGADRTLEELGAHLTAAQPPYPLKPAGTCRLSSDELPFRPYADFWRMERSNLLMYLPFLLKGDQTDFQSFVHSGVRRRCQDLLRDMIKELDSVGRHTLHLCHYYRDGAKNPLLHGDNRPVDWGLAAELAALLRIPAIQRLVKSERHGDALATALVDTFDRYHEQPELFKFTHGTSFGRYLLLADRDLIHGGAVERLDSLIDATVEEGCSESQLNYLCKALHEDAFAGAEENAGDGIEPLRDLLVDKLEQGEQIEKSQKQTIEASGRVSTIRFFDGEGGVNYIDYYGRTENVIQTLVTRIKDVVKWPESDRRKRALDVGCGPGQYAKLLDEAGFEVSLLDASEQMLRCAHDVLKRVGDPPRPRHLQDLRNSHLYRDDEFDLVFACALMVHVPRREAGEVYQSFYRILCPGGALFVNFKIGDHTLLGVGKEYGKDERFFEYYRDQSIPWTMLEEAGFDVHEVTLRWNRKTMFHDPKRIHWANFYCTKRIAANDHP